MWVRSEEVFKMIHLFVILVMIANDINEIKARKRKDTAPEGEKRVELHLHTPMSQMDAVTSVC